MAPKRKKTPVTASVAAPAPAPGPCFLDIKDLLKFNPSLNYFSPCPACKKLVSEHSDIDFQREQVEKFTAEQNEEEKEERGPGLPPPRKKRQKPPIPTDVAATLVQQGKLCVTIGCVSRPVYNSLGLKPLFCRLHKEEGMVNTKDKVKCCEQAGCDNPATHKEFGKKKCKKLCDIHKLEGMIKLNVSTNVCAVESCVKTPCYNFGGEKARYCTQHKEEGMVNVKKVECQAEGCELTASFNLPGKKFSRFCSHHKVISKILN